jgi:hypothetical protein
MKKSLMMTLAGASTLMTLAGTASSIGFAADAETNLGNAAKAAGNAASEKSAEVNAGAKVNSEQMKADAEGVAAASASTVTGTIKHRARQATHKVKAASAKVSEKYHGEMAHHYANKAAADVSASMDTGR